MGGFLKILLVNPPTPAYMPNKEYLIPQGLLYLASYMQSHGEYVEIFDFNIYKPWEDIDNTFIIETLSERVRQVQPKLIGFGCLFSGQFTKVLSASQILKKHHPDIPIVIGGMHPTIFYKEILENCPSIDYVIIGEGELQLSRLVNHLKNQNKDFNSVSDGIAYRNDNDIVIIPKRSFIERLDELPFPAYDLIDFEEYKHDTSHWHNPRKFPIDITVPLITSRSCPCKCNFCSMHLVGGTRFRTRTPSNVFSEIKKLYHEKGIRHFNFMDDNLTINKKRIIALCDLIVRNKINIQFETLNGLMVNTLDEELIDAMYKAGWVRGALAIESGSDYIRNQVMKKKLTEKKIFEVVERIKEYKDIWIKAYFIIGMPEDTVQTLTETYSMIEKLNVDEVYVTNIVPYPGTSLFEQVIRDGLFIDEINVNELWKNESFYMTNKNRFYINTYTMNQSDLLIWRKKIDSLLMQKYSRKV